MCVRDRPSERDRGGVRQRLRGIEREKKRELVSDELAGRTVWLAWERIGWCFCWLVRSVGQSVVVVLARDTKVESIERE